MVIYFEKLDDELDDGEVEKGTEPNSFSYGPFPTKLVGSFAKDDDDINAWYYPLGVGLTDANSFYFKCFMSHVEDFESNAGDPCKAFIGFMDSNAGRSDRNCVAFVIEDDPIHPHCNSPCYLVVYASDGTVVVSPTLNILAPGQWIIEVWWNAATRKGYYVVSDYATLIPIISGETSALAGGKTLSINGAGWNGEALGAPPGTDSEFLVPFESWYMKANSGIMEEIGGVVGGNKDNILMLGLI